MTSEVEISSAPVWRIAGLSLLLLSFGLTGWMLGHAAIAVDHLLDSVSGLFPHGASIFDLHGGNGLIG